MLYVKFVVRLWELYIQCMDIWTRLNTSE